MPHKVIVVSGATSGIGLACLRELAEAGHTVVGFGRSGDKVAGLLPELVASHGADRVQLSALDIRDTAEVANFISSVVQTKGRIDGLINAAGLLELERSHKVSDAGFVEQVDVLFKGTFMLTREVIRPMMKAKDGLVVNIGSVSGQRPAPGMAVYGAAKAAVQHLTSSLAAEYAAKGIRFLCVSPGPVQTGLMDPLMFEMLAKKVPLQRLGRPEEVAALIGFLFTEKATFMTGSTIAVDGGTAL